MDERHKKILQQNRVNLVKNLDPSNLYDALLEKGVFTQDMIDEIRVLHDTEINIFGRRFNPKQQPSNLSFLPSELWDQTRPGQTISPGLGNPREESLSDISGVSPGNWSTWFGRNPTEWGSACSYSTCDTHTSG